MKLSWLLIAVFVAACGSSASSGGGPATSPTGSGGANASPPSQNGGDTGSAKGYDCATLLTPAELDQAAGLSGGTVTTTSRGDQPEPGEVAGVTECGIEVPTVSVWFGSFAVYTGAEALANYETVWEIAKQNGAVALPGVGTDALIVSTPELGVHGYARGNGVALEIGVSWDDQSTTEQKVKDAVKQILTTVLSRATP